MKLTVEEIRVLAQQFAPDSVLGCPKAFGGGHINDTFLLEREVVPCLCCSASTRTFSPIPRR